MNELKIKELKKQLLPINLKIHGQDKRTKSYKNAVSQRKIKCEMVCSRTTIELAVKILGDAETVDIIESGYRCIDLVVDKGSGRETFITLKSETFYYISELEGQANHISADKSGEIDIIKGDKWLGSVISEDQEKLVLSLINRVRGRQ